MNIWIPRLLCLPTSNELCESQRRTRECADKENVKGKIEKGEHARD